MIGRHLSHYEIVEAIGSGGMGEVYRARDTKLGRDVAIKVLPKEFSRDKDRLARFEREARLLAQLNHANIATLHGFETFEGQRFLVMELVEGETLAEKIERGAIPIAEALPIFRQIAEGLEAAHEKGIIHRDLKPANIKITPDGKVKILDFGLAKAFSSEDDVSAATSHSPTLTKGTALGAILGTAPYMSPEQARGNAVDRRTDVWAFGCCLYEALTGKATFRGNTVSDTIANVLKQEPEWNKLPHRTPPVVRTLLLRCLAKDRKQRLRDIGDALLEIESAMSAPHSEADRHPPATTRSWAVGVGSFILGAAAVGLALRPDVADVAPKPVTRLEVPIESPVVERFGAVADLSPDGRTIVYVMERDGNTQIYQRSMSSVESRVIPGSEGARQPFFSHDGQWVGFVADGALRRLPLAGGSPITIGDAPEFMTDAVWGPDGNIVIGAFESGVLEVPASGGILRPISNLQRERGEIGHLRPTLLPGNQAVLFTTAYGSPFDPTIDLVIRETGERRTLMPGGRALYVEETGHLVIMDPYGDVVAVRFDLVSLEVIGEPVRVLEGVAINRWGFPLLNVSRSGSLLYDAGDVYSVQLDLRWVDRAGATTSFGAPLRGYSAPMLSPDKTRVALHIMAPEGRDVWVYDLESATQRRLTFDPAPDTVPIWTPDGERIVFESLRDGVGLYSESAAFELL